MSQLEAASGTQCRSGEQVDCGRPRSGRWAQTGTPAPVGPEHRRDRPRRRRGTGGITDTTCAPTSRTTGRRSGPDWPARFTSLCRHGQLLPESGVYALEECLENTENPYYGGSFTYGRPLDGHVWHPMNHAELVRTMLAGIGAQPRERRHLASRPGGRRLRGHRGRSPGGVRRGRNTGRSMHDRRRRPRLDDRARAPASALSGPRIWSPRRSCCRPSTRSQKWIGRSVPITEVVWARNAFQVAFAFAVFAPRLGWRLLSDEGPLRIQLMRRPRCSARRPCTSWPSEFLPLAETAAITFTAPVDHSRARRTDSPRKGPGEARWLRHLLGFLGVVAVIQPFTGGCTWRCCCRSLPPSRRASTRF